jgi:dolichol kinase
VVVGVFGGGVLGFVLGCFLFLGFVGCFVGLWLLGFSMLGSCAVMLEACGC